MMHHSNKLGYKRLSDSEDTVRTSKQSLESYLPCDLDLKHNNPTFSLDTPWWCSINASFVAKESALQTIQFEKNTPKKTGNNLIL